MHISQNSPNSNSPIRILLAEESSFSQVGIRALENLGELDAFDLTQDDLTERIGTYDVLVLRLGLRADRQVIANGKNLKVIVTPTTGIDHIDLQAADEFGVALLCLKGERDFLDQVYATAEHTFGLLLAVVRKIPAAFDSVKHYQWRRDVYRGRELDGKTIGIIGCGRLGSMVVRYAKAFGMHVIVYDPYQENLPKGIEQVDSLDLLLGESDIVSVHVPLNKDTRHLLSEREFSQMREGAYLVNTSRGAIIDEKALLRALQSGHLAGAAVDVICDEHLVENEKENPLIEYAKAHDHLIITPHIAGATQESVEKADLFVIDKLKNWLAGLGGELQYDKDFFS